MNTLAKSGPKGLPIATPSTCWYRWPLKIKWQFFTDSDGHSDQYNELANEKQEITDYIDGFIHRNIGEQVSNIKTSRDNIA